MINILILLESSIFFILAAIHFYWASGEEWGLDQALPTNEKGERMLNPRKIDCAIVAFGLLGCGLFFLLKMGLFTLPLPRWIMDYGAYAIAAVFLIRAVGDFNIAGFFKKKKDTEFARMDSKLFSPLCLVIGLLAILIQVF